MCTFQAIFILISLFSFLYSFIIFILLPIPGPFITSSGFAYYFSELIFCMRFLFQDKGTVIKTSANGEHSSSATYVCSPNFSVECHYRKMSLPLPRYYPIIFTIPHGNTVKFSTVVTAVLPISPLPCHPL